MTDILKDIAHGVAVGAKDTVKALGDVISYGDKILKIIETASELTPELRTSISTVITAAEAVGTAAAPALAAGGENVEADLLAIPTVVPAVIKLAQAVLALAPQLKTVVKDVDADLKS